MPRRSWRIMLGEEMADIRRQALWYEKLKFWKKKKQNPFTYSTVCPTDITYIRTLNMSTSCSIFASTHSWFSFILFSDKNSGHTRKYPNVLCDLWMMMICVFILYLPFLFHLFNNYNASVALKQPHKMWYEHTNGVCIYNNCCISVYRCYYVLFYH